MASGFGYTGGRSRCHPFWQEFAKCYAGAEDPQECVLQRADYLECLHHTKEITRARTIKSHYLQAEAKRLAQKKEEAETRSTAPGGIMGLNLIVLDNDTQPTHTAGSGPKDQPGAQDKQAAKASVESKKQAS